MLYPCFITSTMRRCFLLGPEPLAGEPRTIVRDSPAEGRDQTR